MLEIALGIAVTVMMGKVAAADDQSAIVWAAVTFLLCYASLYLPLPFFRMLVAGFCSFVLMIAYKTIRDK